MVSADMGEGHNATARGLEEAARVIWPDVAIVRVDTLDVMGPGVGPLFRRIYVANVESTPWLYEYFYASLWRHRWFANACKRFVAEWGGRQLGAVVGRVQPDLVLSTYPLGSSALGWLRRRGHLPMPAAAWISDFAPHPFWVHRELDHHFVMHEAAVEPALAAVPDAVVSVCAPPVVSAFHPREAAATRRVLGLPVDAFVAVVACGALGFGSVERAVDALVAAPDQVHVVVVCGRNDALRRRLQGRHGDDPRVTVLGWTEAMPDWTAAADVIVTNAGGATSLEALASARPVIMFEPIAAHGRANAELMHAAGLAELCATPAQLTRVVTDLAGNRERRDALTEAVLGHLGRHDLAGGLRELAADLRELAADRPAGSGGPGGSGNPGSPGPGVARRRIRAADALFLDVETPTVAQQVGAVAFFGSRADGSPLTAADVRRTVAARATALPTLRRRLADPGSWGAVRHWVDDPLLDLSELVTSVELAPGRELTEVVDAFYAQQLDRGRQLWRMQVVRGLPEDRTALLIKLHHSLGDGLSVIGTIDGLIDRSQTPAVPAGSQVPAGGRPGPARSGPARPDRAPQRHLIPSPATARRVVGDGWAVVRGLVGLALAGPAPAVSAGGRRSGGHPHIVMASLPTAQVQRVARALGVTSGDLVLTVIAAAVAGLLGVAGPVRPGQTVRAMVPLSLRERSRARRDPDAVADGAQARAALRTWGNWTGAVPVDLPVGPLTPVERLRLLCADVNRKARGGQPRAAQLVVSAIGHLPGRLHTRAARAVYQGRWFTLIASYMPAARGRRYLAGAPLVTAYPVLPMAEGVGLAVGVLARGSEISFGLTTDPSLVPGTGRLPELVVRAFQELAAAAAGTSG